MSSFDRFLLVEKPKIVAPVFFDDSSYEVVIFSPEANVADICACKELTDRLDTSDEPDVYLRIPGKSDSKLDLEALLAKYAEGDSKSTFFLRSSSLEESPVEHVDASVAQHLRRGKKEDLESRIVVFPKNRESRSRRSEVNPFAEPEDFGGKEPFPPPPEEVTVGSPSAATEIVSSSPPKGSPESSLVADVPPSSVPASQPDEPFDFRSRPRSFARSFNEGLAASASPPPPTKDGSVSSSSAPLPKVAVGGGSGLRDARSASIRSQASLPPKQHLRQHTIEKLEVSKKFSAEVVTSSRSLNFGLSDDELEDAVNKEEPPALLGPRAEDNPEEAGSTPGALETEGAVPEVAGETEQADLQSHFERLAVGQVTVQTPPRKLPTKKPNPPRILGKTGPLAVPSPSALRVILVRASARRESHVIREVSLSGILLVLRDGLWVLKDEEQRKDVSFLADAPGPHENLKVEDVDLPGALLARFLSADKRWVICQKPAGEVTPASVVHRTGAAGQEDAGDDGFILDTSTDGADSEDDFANPSALWAPTPLPLLPERTRDETRERSATTSSTASQGESRATLEERLLAALENLKKGVEAVTEWFNHPESQSAPPHEGDYISDSDSESDVVREETDVGPSSSFFSFFLSWLEFLRFFFILVPKGHLVRCEKQAL